MKRGQSPLGDRMTPSPESKPVKTQGPPLFGGLCWKGEMKKRKLFNCFVQLHVFAFYVSHDTGRSLKED